VVDQVLAALDQAEAGESGAVPGAVRIGLHRAGAAGALLAQLP